MFHYKRFVVNPIEENCYIIWDDASHEGAIIDCGTWSSNESRSISDFIHKEGIKLKYSLQTHMHFDHCLGLAFICSEYGLTPMCHPEDLPVYHGAPESSTLCLGDTNIQVLHTPGHTPGGVCYYIPNGRIVLTGDTLFRMGIGRTDLPGGNYEQELHSISSKIFILPADTKVLPGHGPESTVGEEIDCKPYLH